MEQRKFTPEELILVDTHELVDHERWVPGVYLEQVDVQKHLVEIMENGKRVTRAYKTMCLRHADEAYSLEVKFEVYVDSYYGGDALTYGDVLTYEGVDGEKKAIESAEEWVSQTNAPKDDVVIDRVVVGGTHPFKTFPPKK